MRTSQEMMLPLQTAYVMVNCEAGYESDVIEHLSSIGGIKEVVRTTGHYDILCSVETTTVESLREIIEQKIRRTSHLVSTTTLVKSY